MKRKQQKLEAFIQKESNLLVNISKKINVRQDPYIAYTALKGVLHVIRDTIPTNEVFYLSCRLPETLRQLYFEGYYARDIAFGIYKQQLFEKFNDRQELRSSNHFSAPHRLQQISKKEFLKKLQARMGYNNPVKPEIAYRAVLWALYIRLSDRKQDRQKIKSYINTNKIFEVM